MGLGWTLFGSVSGTMVVCYTRALGKRPLFTKPWEHLIFGVVLGGYMAEKVRQGEEYYATLLDKLVMDKMRRNNGVLEEKFRSMLGSRYSKYFPEAE